MRGSRAAALFGVIWSLGALACGETQSPSPADVVVDAPSDTATDGSGDAPDNIAPDALAPDTLADGAADVPADVPKAEERPTEPATDTYLLATQDVPWNKLTSGVLKDPKVTLQLCTDHFPVGSQARKEALRAAAWYTDAGPAQVSVTLTEAPHRPTKDMYVDKVEEMIPTMDYVTEGYPCHKKLACSDKYEDGKKIADGFALNVCKCRTNGCFGGSGKVVGFNVAVNSLCKNHFKDPAAKDFPKSQNIAHEYGHGYGMIHTPSWPVAYRGFVSTMQGNLWGLGVVDWALMRHHHGGPELKAPQLRPSPQARVAKDPANLSAGFRRVAFAAEWNNAPKKIGTNPVNLYLKDGAYLDCATEAAPVYTVTWFNEGSACEAEQVHRLVAASDGAKVVLGAWNALAMPQLAQDSWRGQLQLAAAQLSALPKGAELSLRLELDVYGDCQESDEEDNVISGVMRLHASAASCPQ